jgi:hypothetical protein
MAKKHDKERNDRYFQLHHYMLKSDAWRGLSQAARVVYIQIGFRYNGANNGKIAYSVRDAARVSVLIKRFLASKCDLPLGGRLRGRQALA